MYVLRVTGEQLIGEISKRQTVQDVADGQTPQADRRGARRLRTMPAPVPCRVVSAAGAMHKSAFLNFSDSGALLEGPMALERGEEIEIFVSFADSRETFTLKARMVRRQADDLGVQFA